MLDDIPVSFAEIARVVAHTPVAKGRRRLWIVAEGYALGRGIGRKENDESGDDSNSFHCSRGGLKESLT